MLYQNTATSGFISGEHSPKEMVMTKVCLGIIAILFVMIISIMISLSPSLTLYALMPLPLLSFLVYVVMKKVHKRYTKIQEKFSELTTLAQENFSGIRVIKSYVREDYEIKKYTKHC
jgi:ATP-binding cassette subfamily B protein